MLAPRALDQPGNLRVYKADMLLKGEGASGAAIPWESRIRFAIWGGARAMQLRFRDQGDK